MLRAMIPVMQTHFNLQIDDQAIISAVQASNRYISGRQLPDKAISVLDTAAARVALTQNAQPVVLDHLKAQLHNLQLEQQLITQEHQQLPIYQERLSQLKQQLVQLEQEIADTEKRWQQELNLVQQIQQLNTQNASDVLDKVTQLRIHLAELIFF